MKAERVVFIGSKELGLSIFKEMYYLSPKTLKGCITIDDREDSRSQYNEILDFCDQINIVPHVLISSKGMKDIIEELKPDICFVINWYYIIDKEILDLAEFGFLGIHNSSLPKYRGFAPLVWAMIQGEKKAGFSIFTLGEGMDEGDIWATDTVLIRETDDIGQVIKRIQESLIKIFEDIYIDILFGNIIPQKQEKIPPTYCAKRAPKDGIIDWSQSAVTIHNFIRAQARPYAGAYTTYKDKIMRIWKGRVYPYTFYGYKGQIGLIAKNEIVVVCGGNTAIVLEEVEYEGQTAPPSQFVRSLNIKFE